MSKWVFPNGTYYQGAFTNNKPNGQGTWYFENGNQVSGAFQQKKIEPEDDADPIAYQISWESDTKISDAAYQVNTVEQF